MCQCNCDALLVVASAKAASKLMSVDITSGDVQITKRSVHCNTQLGTAFATAVRMPCVVLLFIHLIHFFCLSTSHISTECGRKCKGDS